jgi:phosphate acetyltransferase
MDPEYANDTLFHGVIGHGTRGGSLISTVLYGTVFPGPGTIYLEQNLRFSRPVRVGDSLTVTVTCSAKQDDKKAIELECTLVNQKNERVRPGTARVLAPSKKVSVFHVFTHRTLVMLDPVGEHAHLLNLGANLEAVVCGVVHPCDQKSSLQEGDWESSPCRIDQGRLDCA